MASEQPPPSKPLSRSEDSLEADSISTEGCRPPPTINGSDDNLNGTAATKNDADTGQTDDVVVFSASVDTPSNHCGNAAPARSNKRRLPVVGRMSRPRNKVKETSHSLLRPLLKRSTSLPAVASKFKHRIEGRSDGRTAGHREAGRVVRPLLHQLGVDNRQTAYHRHSQPNQQPAPGQHAPTAVHAALKTSLNPGQLSHSNGDHSGSDADEQAAWSHGLTSSDPVVNDTLPSPVPLSPGNGDRSDGDADHQRLWSTAVDNHDSLQSRLAGKSGATASSPSSSSSRLSPDRDTSDLVVTRQPAVGEDALDGNGNSVSAGSDTCTTGSMSPKISTPTSPQTDSGDTKDSTAASSEERRSEATAEHQPYNADVKPSPGYGGRPTNRADCDNQGHFSVPYPYLTDQYVMHAPVFNNRGRGHFVNRPYRRGYPFQAASPHYPGYYQVDGMFTGYKLNRRRENQSCMSYNQMNGYRYAPVSGSYYGKAWLPRSSRGGRPVVIGGVAQRRGWGGLFSRGRGGFNSGRGGAFHQQRFGGPRFPFCPGRGRGRSNGFVISGRTSPGWRNFKAEQEQREGRRTNGMAGRHGDGSHWEEQDNGFSRGRTQHKTNMNRPAHRHCSAPSGRDQTTTSVFGSRQLRPRSLSRSPTVNHDWPGDSQQPGNGKFWNYSPNVDRTRPTQRSFTRRNAGPFTPRQNAGPFTPRQNAGPFTPRQNAGPFTPHQNAGPFTPRQNAGPLTPRQNAGPFTARQNSGSNPYFWSREMHGASNGMRPAHSGQNRLDHDASIGRQLEVSHLIPQNDGSYLCPDDPQQHGAASAAERVAATPQPEGLDTLEQAVPGPQDGPPVAQELEQEAGTGQGEMNGQYSEQRGASPLQNGSDTRRHQNTETHVYGRGEPSGVPRFSDEQRAANQPEKCQATYQQHGRRRRDGSNSALGRWTSGSAVSPKWSGRPLKTTHWRDGSQPANHVQQHARRLPTGLQQQNGSRVNHHHLHESLGYEHKRTDTALPTSTNVSHWHQHIPCDIPLWNSEASSLQGQGNSAAITQQRSLRIAGSPPAPMGDSLYEDFLWKIMQLQVLHEHQHIDQLEVNHILKALMGMRLPAETTQFLATQLGETCPRNSNGPNRFLQSKIVNSSSEFNNNQHRYLLNVSRQGNYQGFDRVNNQNVAFPFVPQKNGVSCSGNIGSASPPYSQPMPHVNWQHQPGLHANLHSSKCNHGVHGHRRLSHTKEKQPGRKSVKENRAQYVYYLENQHQKRGDQLTVQCEHDPRRWQQHTVTPFSAVQDANGNHQNSLYLDQSHAVRTLQQNGQRSQPNYIEQPGRWSGSGQQSPQSVTQSWSSGHDGTNDKDVLEPQPTLDNPSIVGEQTGTDTAGQQAAADRDNGNAVPVQDASDGGFQLQPISNTNQPVLMPINFPQQGTALHTPVFPIQYQPGPMNAPYLQPVNTPLFSPMQTPYFPTMGMPAYPQQNVFQYPSPLPYYSFASPGQVGPPPNIFQFPDPAAGQQSMANNQTVGQPQCTQDQHYGFAGNHPLAQFPPTIDANAAPFEPHPGCVKVNGNTVG